MAKATSQWACIVILALMGSTFTMAHAVRPPHRPARSRRLQMDKDGEPETNNFQASDPDGIAAQHHSSQMDETEAIASGCREDKGIYGGGHGSGVTSIKFPNIFPFPVVFPFGGLVPQITTWGEGGGYGGAGADNKPGCQCTHNRLPVHYVITPVYFQPMNSKDDPSNMAPSPSED